MSAVRIIHRASGSLLASQAQIAATFFPRLKGLLGTKKLEEGCALVIVPCSSVHTVGMRYPIDVLFVNRQDIIIKITASMMPGRFSLAAGAHYVIELPSGTAAQYGCQAGDELLLQ